MGNLRYKLRGRARPGGHNGGLSQVQFSYPEFAFLNYVKTMQAWCNVTGGATCNPAPATFTPAGFDFDVNGYPRNIPVGTGGCIGLIQIPNDSERDWADVGGVGSYTLTWDGGGTIALANFTLVTSNTPTSNLVSAAASTGNMITIRPGTNRPSIGVSAVTSSSDYPHNFNLYYTADQADVDAGYITTPIVRQRWAEANIGQMRNLSFLGGDGNRSHIKYWADNKPEAHVSYYMEEQRTAIFAGKTTSAVAGHFVLPTFSHPDYGTAAAVDGQLIIVQFNTTLTVTEGYLTYNGREDRIINEFMAPISSADGLTTGKPGVDRYAPMRYDEMLQAWIAYGNSGQNYYIANGVPPGVFLDICAELRCHPHFVLPGPAHDEGTGAPQITDYFGELVDMVRARAASWMIPNYEGCNEWWNTQPSFLVYYYSNARQKVRNGGEIPGATAAIPFMATSMISNPAVSVTSPGATSGTGGKIRLKLAGTGTTGMTTGEFRTITGVGGAVEANGYWPITVYSATEIELDGSTFVNAWTSGGSVAGQCTMTASGSAPPLGAYVTTLGTAPSGFFGFSASTAGQISAVSGSTFKFDVGSTTSGTWSGNTGTATLTLVGSTVAVPYAVTLNHTIMFSSGSTLPAPLVANKPYYVKATSASSVPFQISLTPSGTAIDFSAGSQAGTHTASIVISLNPIAADFHNSYGCTASQMGQLLVTKYGGSPKTQTMYKMVVGVKGQTGKYSTSESNNRLLSKPRVIASGNASEMAKFYVTHSSPANYFASAVHTCTTAQQAALYNAWDGELFTAGIAGNQLTVASFQTTASTKISVGDIIFGYGLPPLGDPAQVTVLSIGSVDAAGVGTYTLSSSAYTVATGTSLYSGTDYTAVQQMTDAHNQAQFMGYTSGTTLEVTSITPSASGVCGTIYPNSSDGCYLGHSSLTSAVYIRAQTGGTTGGVGTYTISSGAGTIGSVGTPVAFTADGVFTLQVSKVYNTNWKAWAQSFGVNKQNNYEGGYSSDNTGGGTSKRDLLFYAGKWCHTSTCWTEGVKSVLLQNFADNASLTDGTFTAEFPSTFNFEGRYPSTNIWAVWETYYHTSKPPMVEALEEYNN